MRLPYRRTPAAEPPANPTAQPPITGRNPGDPPDALAAACAERVDAIRAPHVGGALPFRDLLAILGVRRRAAAVDPHDLDAQRQLAEELQRRVEGSHLS